MDKLKNIRKCNRRLFTKACNEYSKKEAELSADEKIVHLRLIEDKAKLMIETEYAIRQEQFYNATADLTEQEIEKEIDESEAYIDKWRILEQKLFKLIQSEKENSVIDESPQNKLLNYPKIQLPVFDGNIKNWLGFWGQFQKIDKDPNLDKHDKFAYLSQAMEKGSVTDELVKSFPPGAESYDKALKQLHSRFGREDLLIEVYVRDLLSLVLRKNSNQECSLRKLYDSLESKLRALEVLGVARDKYAAMLYPLVESSLPDETLRVWERFRAQHRRNKNSATDSKNLTLQEISTDSLHRTDLDNLLLFLLDEIEGEERVCIASRCFDTGMQNRQSKVTRTPFKCEQPNSRATAATLIAASNETQNMCIFCSSMHKSNNCFKARKMPLVERQAVVEKAHSCFLCLKKGHVVAKCRIKAGCLLCGKRHHLLLCRSFSKQQDNVNTAKNDELSIKQDEALANFSRSPDVILQTLVVTLRGHDKKCNARAIVDTASQRSYILKSTAEAMGYECIKKEQLRHSLFGGSTTDVLDHEVFNIALSKLGGNYNCHFDALGQEVICNTIPSIRSGEWMQELEAFSIHLHDRKAGPIEILIGADVAGKLMTGGYKLLNSGLAAIETKLGWTVMGKNPTSNAHESTALFVTTLLTKDAAISDLWTLDSLGILDPSEKKTKEELHKAAKEHFLSTVVVDKDDRFVVHLPWLDDHPPLPDNFNLALKRLYSTVKKLRSEKLYEDYGEVLKEWENEGIIEKVPMCEMETPCHYLPHRHVVKENSTTKIKPVFDASAKHRLSPSLNDCLEKGLNLIELIPSILTRFRMKKIRVSADIRKAFLQIGLNPKDKNFLRFLWNDDNGQLIHYRHNRVVFGVSCSPFLPGSVNQYHIESTLNKALNANSKYPVNMVQKLANSFYVDNCLTGVEDKMELEKFIKVATDIMAERKFDLRGWEYSDEDCKTVEPACILGMLWERNSDNLSLNVPSIEDYSFEKISKRIILAAAHKIFDPLCLACPVTLLPKFLLQRLWKSKVSWDEDVDSDTKSQFLKWMKNLHYLKDVKIPRWLQCDLEVESLHFFCDASKFAYSAVAFVRICTSVGSIQVHLLRAKARITPCGEKETTISRLELLAATIAARLASDVFKEFETRNVYFWTDSSTALSWIKREEAWGIFVQNRVEEIRRFIARRERISVLNLNSDNGTNFTGTNNALKAIDWNSITTFSTAQKISWKFNPPTAAWWGGWWERMVRMLKELLRRVLGKATVDYEELLTVLCDCEAVINSRPLTYISNESDDLMSLTPAMFIHGSTTSETPDLDTIDRSFLVKRSKYIQKILEDLRQRFKSEYLSLLVHRGCRRNNELKIGDVVLIGSDTTKRIDWPLGIVLEIYPGKDGIPRVAKVKTSIGERVRPFQRLFPLEISSRSDAEVLEKSHDITELIVGPNDFTLQDSEPSHSETKCVYTPNVIETPPIITRSGRKIKIPDRLGL